MDDSSMYPMRINRYLALRGQATRRAADKLIAAGKVSINGRIAKLGDKVNAKDKVEIAERPAIKYTYLTYHKPAGEPTMERYLGKLFPLGRLDKESRGLMILTDDGRLTDRLLNPDYDHEKEYLVSVDKPLKEGVLNRFARGMLIEGETDKTRPAIIDQEDQYTFRITLTEGKKHQIRRMCAAWGYTVTDLLRVRIANVELESLGQGKTRPIGGRVLNEFLASLQLPPN